ncbi:hypothetical protein GWK47_020288 [Chionoecetes opilio]|uniref:Uncharacterized protein n=1 Tax=Chionoecetes opilio TaxID=41210 RepID=A0A8J4XQ88_CHIOP|nr:hypothetical protein GWK47_020288 [Chionoecetes opilio]
MIRLKANHQRGCLELDHFRGRSRGDQEERFLYEAPESCDGQRLTRRLTQSLKDHIKVPSQCQRGPHRNLYLRIRSVRIRGDGQASAPEDSALHRTGTFEGRHR